MDYEKEYKEMVKRVKELHEAGNALTKKQMEIICPELAESEDERINRAIFKALSKKEARDVLRDEYIQVSDALAYLERQKEGNLVDKKYVQEAFNKGMQAGMMRKPAEWSEEDKRKIVELKTFIAQCKGFNKENQKKAFDMIDALLFQPHWKPSEEQMSCLWQASIYYKSGKIKITGKVLESLYVDLQNYVSHEIH